jgi:hypothetical protein
VKVNVQLEVTTTDDMLLRSDKTKKFTDCRSLLKQTFCSFLFVLKHDLNYLKLPICQDSLMEELKADDSPKLVFVFV